MESGPSLAENTHQQVSKFNTFTEILNNFNFNCGPKKVPRPRQQKLCVVRQGGVGLVKLSTNEKRARECTTNLPGFNTKKMRF